MRRSLVALALVAGLLAACGGSASIAPHAATSPGVPADPSAPVATPIVAPSSGAGRQKDVKASTWKTIKGLVDGDLTVTRGSVLILYGQVEGDLIVEKGARAEVYGHVVGDLVNRGGSVTVYGMVEGQVIKQGGTTVLVSGSHAGGSVAP
jgi:hypothetical protein